MTTIVTRAGKGSALTHAEMDANFTNLNNDKIETSILANYSTTIETDDSIAAALAVHIDDTIDAHVSSAIGYLPAGTGAVATDVQSKLRENTSPKDRGAVVDGATNDYAALQNLATDGDVVLANGTSLIKTGISCTQPVIFKGRGVKSIIKVASDFVASDNVFYVSPAAGTEKRNWQFKDFQVTNAGTAANNVFQLNLVDTGKFLNKFTISGVIADAVAGKFVELLNPTNVDGLFSSVFEDNWSLNGYYFDNIGDSVICQRNTVSGSGVGYYVNQLGTASHLMIKDCNITSAGGALHSVKSMNLRFDNNQVECTAVFTGSNNAAVSLTSSTSAASHQNPEITRNNINTQANATLRCIYANWTNGLVIEGNTLFCDPSTGAHIYIDANANNSYIGVNKYYSSTTGAEITPLITDLGIGTAGIWKNATNVSSWSIVSAAYGFPLGFFKTRDGIVHLRGNIGGAAPGSGMLLFNLPVGFRPKTKVITIYKPFSGTANCAFQIEANGNVTLLTGTATAIYLDGVSFSTL